MGANFYDLLGLPLDATTEEIRLAYFDAARRLHPDSNPDPSSSELFIKIQEAYETLRNTRRRNAYDLALEKNAVTAPEVSLQIVSSRSCLPRTPEVQLHYVLAEIICKSEPSTRTAGRVNLSLVIDRSTSMQGGRMDMVKNNIQKMFSILQPQDVLSVVAFSDRAEVVLPAAKLGSISQQEMRLNSIRSGGGTEIYQGLFAGIEQLRIENNSQAINQLILITDGRTYGDEAACLALAEQARAEGISISALGIGHEWNDAFLDKLVNISGGSTAYITSPLDLTAFLENTLRTMSRIYARGLTLKFRLDPRVELHSCYRLTQEIIQLPTESPIVLGNLMFGKNETLLLEFLVKPIPTGVEMQRLLNGHLHLEVFEPTPGDARLPVSIQIAVKDQPDSEPPPAKILEKLARVMLYRMQEQARKELAEGNVEKAGERLQVLATHLLARGSNQLAKTVLEEAEHIRHSQRFTKEGDKRIKYGTRALLPVASRSEDNDDLSRL